MYKFIIYLADDLDNVPEEDIINMFKKSSNKDDGKLIIIMMLFVKDMGIQKEVELDKRILTKLLNEYNSTENVNTKNSISKCLTLYINDRIFIYCRIN